MVPTGSRSPLPSTSGMKPRISHTQRRHFLSIINEESQRLSRLIESLLDLKVFEIRGRKAVLTPLAREKARSLGVSIQKERK